MTDGSRDAAVQSMLDRTEITDVLYRYASTIDRRDYEGLRRVFVDDACGRYGDRDWIVGADAIVAWIAHHGADEAWQHHLLSVYHVDIDGDRASALTYHTSHQSKVGTPDVVHVIVARYQDELRRTADGWRIASKMMEVLWRDTRHATKR